jgi:hypothetical protein
VGAQRARRAWALAARRRRRSRPPRRGPMVPSPRRLSPRTPAGLLCLTAQGGSSPVAPWPQVPCGRMGARRPLRRGRALGAPRRVRAWPRPARPPPHQRRSAPHAHVPSWRAAPPTRRPRAFPVRSWGRRPQQLTQTFLSRLSSLASLTRLSASRTLRSACEPGRPPAARVPRSRLRRGVGRRRQRRRCGHDRAASALRGSGLRRPHHLPITFSLSLSLYLSISLSLSLSPSLPLRPYRSRATPAHRLERAGRAGGGDERSAGGGR